MIGTTLSDRAAVSTEGLKADAVTTSGLNMIAARVSPGVISESSSSHLPPSVTSKVAKPVVFPLGMQTRKCIYNRMLLINPRVGVTRGVTNAVGIVGLAHLDHSRWRKALAERAS
jgi:hypothetical protein